MKRFFRFVFTLAVLGFVCFSGFFVWKSWKDAEQLESVYPLSSLVERAQSQPQYVPYDQISPFLEDAIISLEDARFYQHSGIDFIGLSRAVLSQFLPFMAKSGGSSITQQTVKNLYGMFDAGPEWKGEEIILAMKLEKICSKEEILALYLNIINFGDGHTGIAEASWGYFGVSPMDLSEGQAAILAGIPQTPANFQLSDHFPQAKAKQQVVLSAMVRNEEITREQAEQIFAEPLVYFNGYTWVTGTAWITDPAGSAPYELTQSAQLCAFFCSAAVPDTENRADGQAEYSCEKICGRDPAMPDGLIA